MKMPFSFSGLDGFRRLPKELTEGTNHGAYLTIIAFAICSLLFLSELQAWLSHSIIKTTELDSHYQDTIWIQFDITMNALPCKYTNVTVRDIINQKELPILHRSITKQKRI